MNHIHNLTEQLNEARAQVARTREALVMLELYLASQKFHREDYVYVSTDILPKLRGIRAEMHLNGR